MGGNQNLNKNKKKNGSYRKCQNEISKREEQTPAEGFGNLDNQTCSEDLHTLFPAHGELKWVDFATGAKEGITLKKKASK